MILVILFLDLRHIFRLLSINHLPYQMDISSFNHRQTSSITTEALKSWKLPPNLSLPASFTPLTDSTLWPSRAPSFRRKASSHHGYLHVRSHIFKQTKFTISDTILYGCKDVAVDLTVSMGDRGEPLCTPTFK